MTKTVKSLLLLVLIAATVGCDRVTKNLAHATLDGTSVQSLLGDTVRLEYAENTGGFLSLGATLEPQLRAVMFCVGTGLILAALLVTAIQFRQRTWYVVGACLALAGGASNLIDRLIQHAVIDFVSVGIGDHLRTGIFNIADVAILLGICVMMFSLSQPKRTIHS
jgi:signal peptidase II